MKGILLVNLGSPKSPTAKDVKPYLDEFLMDPKVIDMPYLLRAFIVKGIILNTRPEKSAQAYQKIWWPEGSPLIVLSEKLRNLVQKGTDLKVALAMRYGEPSIQQGIEELISQNVTDILMIPLYPQYAMATTQTIEELAEKIISKKYPTIKLKSMKAFYNKKQYIEALSNNIATNLNGYNYDHIVFSYHGVPERHITKSDVTKKHCKIDATCCSTPSPAHEYCYRHQCIETTRLVVEKLHIPSEKYTISFQSRLGMDRWLQPPTDNTINNLANRGIKKLAVVTPAFVADCLETLEEIGIEAKNEFLKRGGEEFKSIPCLNDDQMWVDAILQWIREWNNN